MSALPPLAPFPQASWQLHLSATDWATLVQAWTTIVQACLDLTDEKLKREAEKNDSLIIFLKTFVHETAHAASPVPETASLFRPLFHLASRLLKLTAPKGLLEYSFLAEFCKLFPRRRTSSLISDLFNSHTSSTVIEASLTSLKKLLVHHLDLGIRGDLKLVESSLVTLNHLLHLSPDACVLLLAGSDFFDGLVTGFKVMNPPLRKAIVTTTYLCIVGLTKSEPPKWSMLNDQLFALKSAAEIHKEGPLNANDSLVGQLVTTTPVLQILLRRAHDNGAAAESLKKRIAGLEAFRNGPMVKPKRLSRIKVNKGKGKATAQDYGPTDEIHVHRMSQITQIQDLFPDLGAGFVAKCLDEYGDDVEQVVANLLAESLPSHLAIAEKSEPLSLYQNIHPKADLAPRTTPPPSQVPVRRNVFDDDDFDRLSADVSKISFGKKPQRNADELLHDKSTAPNKAAILSALAAFDSDDDERDDTYDAADVGGTVDTMYQEADGAKDGSEEALFRAYQINERSFDRDASTRRSKMRADLREETGMTDEAIEGWAVMLVRNPAQKKRLEAKYAFAGQQAQIERTAWRASPAVSGTEDTDFDAAGGPAGGGRGSRGGRGGGGRARGRGGRGGNVAGPTGEKNTNVARRNKEADKGSRANHNRRDARAKKMARGGFTG